jgi:hypothetical protein
MAYAVQLRAEAGAPGPLFSKIEAALREEFAFSLVERSFNSVIYHLVVSLCEDSQSQMHPVPHCGICNEPEPFPTRVSLLDETGKQFIQACYCLRCAAQRADPDDRRFARDLLAADRHGWGPFSGAELIDWPANASDAVPCPGSRLAS